MNSNQPTDTKGTPNMIKRVTEVGIGQGRRHKRVDERTAREERLIYLPGLIIGSGRH